MVEITGGQHMIDISVERFFIEGDQTDGWGNLLPCRRAMTPDGADKQFIHSDNVIKERFNGLIVLSKTATATIFLPKQYPDRVSGLHLYPVVQFLNRPRESCLSPANDVLQELESRIINAVGEDYELGPSLSYLYSPLDHRTTHQVIYADSATGDPYHGLVVLSNQCTPTIFEMRKELHEPLTGLLTVSNANGQFLDQNTRQTLRVSASMLGPVTTLENYMHPISNIPLNAGTVVLFRSDMIHRGLPSNINEDRALLNKKDREILMRTAYNLKLAPTNDPKFPKVKTSSSLRNTGYRCRLDG
ncbi:hypothetical protein BC833DRAFT_635794 [Globomyces pollinis-pini]|nr:hypothetical protein BC833DRAFT_635794 [Globomyces pollinis-pini]